MRERLCGWWRRLLGEEEIVLIGGVLSRGLIRRGRRCMEFVREGE